MSAIVSHHQDTGMLSRSNPTIKLVVLALVSLTAMFILDPLTPTILYAVALFGVAATARPPVRTLVFAQIPFMTFAAGIFIVNTLTRPGVVLWQSGVMRVTAEGLTVGAALAARTMLIGVLAVGFIISTRPVRLMTSLHHNAHLGARITFAILAGYRMLQEMPHEWTIIQQAHSIRTSKHRGRPPRGAGHLAHVIFTLLVVTVRKGERISQALESRGLGLQPRTTWHPIHIRTTDWLFAAVVLVSLAGVIWISAAVGTLTGPQILFGTSQF